MGTRLFFRLDTALRPFVTRSLRGPRLRRTVVAAALLACFATLTGLWLAWGEGELERGEVGFKPLRADAAQEQLDEQALVARLREAVGAPGET